MNTERFKNRAEALKWLQSRGQISTGKFYQDVEAGLISIAADKTISKYQVMEYAERVFGFTRQQAPLMDQAAKKDRLEIELLEQKVEKQKLENRKEDAQWLQKEEAWAQMAGVIGKLRDSIRHQFHIGTQILITASAGDHNRGSEVYEAAESLLSRAFNEIVESGRIDGVFEKERENL